MRLRLGVILMIAIGVLALAGAWVAAGWTPTVPADAASIVLARATVSGEVTTSSQQCLDRITRSAGWLDLCWEAYRQPDGDPDKDYYLLHVYGTLSGSGTGVRWWTVRATLVGQYGQPADGVFDGWPDGTFEGPCQQALVPLWVGYTNAYDTVCGRTTGVFVAPWGHQATWMCVGCVIADRSDRSVAAYESIGVAAGTVPAWDIGADFGD